MLVARCQKCVPHRPGNPHRHRHEARHRARRQSSPAPSVRSGDGGKGVLPCAVRLFAWWPCSIDKYQWRGGAGHLALRQRSRCPAEGGVVESRDRRSACAAVRPHLGPFAHLRPCDCLRFGRCSTSGRPPPLTHVGEFPAQSGTASHLSKPFHCGGYIRRRKHGLEAEARRRPPSSLLTLGRCRESAWALCRGRCGFPGR